MGLSYDHPEGRYCGNQMCCWGPAGKKVPASCENPLRKFVKPTVHIQRDGYGDRPALCGATPGVMVHGGPATATCKRCLTSKVARGWILETENPQAKRMIRQNLRRLGLAWPK